LFDVKFTASVLLQRLLLFMWNLQQAFCCSDCCFSSYSYMQKLD